MRKRNFGIILGLLLAACNVTAWADTDEQPVTLYSPYDASMARNDAFALQQTELVLIQPELKTFTDENSEAAQDYFTAMDDWSYYASEITQRFEALSVPVERTEKHFMIFTLGKGQRMIFDNRKPRAASEEEEAWWAILYRKGQPPIAIDITDSDMTAAKTYLGLK